MYVHNLMMGGIAGQRCFSHSHWVKGEVNVAPFHPSHIGVCGQTIPSQISMHPGAAEP